MKLKTLIYEIILSDKIYYHGTNRSFTKFKYTDDSGVHGDFYGKGVYVTDNLDYAKEFGSTILKCKVKATNPFDLTKPTLKMFDEFLPFIKNKGDITKIKTLVKMKAITTAFKYVRNNVSIEDMKKIGYDCIVAYADHEKGGVEIVVFDPNNIEVI